MENTVFPFRWRDDGRELENRADGACGRGGGQGRSPHQTSNFKIFGKQQSEKQTVGWEGGDKEKEGEAREEEGRKKKKNNNSTKECVIKTGNGRREEGSGGFQKEAVRGRFSRAEEWG